MQMVYNVASALRFRGWEIHPAERLLRVGGKTALIGGRAFDVLVALVEARGDTVPKSKLLDVAWPGLVVEENNVSVQIAALRKLLGPEAIATVTGIGYRLSAAAESSPAAVAPPDVRNVRSIAEGQRKAPSLVGRDADLAPLLELLSHHKLVSIVGTGGVGKTSLALAAIAHDCMQTDMIYWIDLAPLRDVDQLLPLVASTLSIDIVVGEQARQDLVSTMSQMSALLVLDNCEHMVDEVAGFVLQTLEACPSLRWLVTSQERLRVPSEVIYRLDPLQVPPEHAAPDDAAQVGAMALLMQRVLASDRHFVLDGSNVALAIDLCRQLDGLPLAIEMAAARVASVGLATIHGQLRHRLDLLVGSRTAPARHHTLRSTFDWSHDLLTPAEKVLLRRLPVFVGSFGVALVQAVAGDEGDTVSIDSGDVIELLSGLIDKSLVHCSEEGGRYFLYEGIRAYGELQLAQAGEADVIRARHARAVAEWFVIAQSDFEHMGDREWAARYVPEHRNLRAALLWACRHDDADLIARLAASLAQMDSFLEGQAEVLHLPIPVDALRRAAPALRATAWVELAWAHYTQGDREIGTELSLCALEEFKALGDAAGQFRALAQLVRLYESRPGMRDASLSARDALRLIDERKVPMRTRLTYTIAAAAYAGGRRSVPKMEELETIAELSGFESIAALCRVHISDQLLEDACFEEAVNATRQFMARGESRPRFRALILTNQALALIQLGRLTEAEPSARQALQTMPGSASILVDSLALAAARRGRFSEAALMSGFGLHAREVHDAAPDPAEAAAIAETSRLVSAALPSERIAHYMNIGAALSITRLLDVMFSTSTRPMDVLPGGLQGRAP